MIPATTDVVKNCFTKQGSRRLIRRLQKAQEICQGAPDSYEVYGPEGVELAESLLRKYDVLPHHHLYLQVSEWTVRRYAVIKAETASHAKHEDKYPSEKFKVKFA